MLPPALHGNRNAVLLISSSMNYNGTTMKFTSCLVVAACSSLALAQAPPAPPRADHPKVSVRGKTYTPRNILSRNMGTREDQQTQFPPHKVIGNVYYVGTKTLSSFLIVTPQGNILVNSLYERSLPAVQKSVE